MELKNDGLYAVKEGAKHFISRKKGQTCWWVSASRDRPLYFLGQYMYKEGGWNVAYSDVKEEPVFSLPMEFLE